MMNILIKYLQTAKYINGSIKSVIGPPSEPIIPPTQDIIPHSIIIDTRDYIEKISFQINGAYSKGWYDACAVMIRRLLETLIIEVYEAYNISHKIKNPTGDFFFLKDLMRKFLTESSWNISRNIRRAFPKLKDIGDKSAHSRRFIAHRNDIDKLKIDVRTIVQELIYISRLK